MGIELARAFVAIRADGSQFASDVESLRPQMESTLENLMLSLQSRIRSLLAMVGMGLGFGQMISMLREATFVGEASTNAYQRLEAAIKATGGSAGLTAKEIEDFADEMRKTTGISDESIAQAATRIMTFGSITGDTFKEVLKLSADLAARGFGSVESAAFALGRALESPGRSMMTLRRMGIVLTAEQEKQLKLLQQQGQEDKARAMLLDVVRSKVGGIAQEVARTPAGQLRILREEYGEMKEALGKHLLPAAVELKKVQMEVYGTVSQIVGVVGQAVGKFLEWDAAHDRILSKTIAVATSVVSLTIAVRKLGGAFAVAARAVQMALVGTGIGALVVAVGVAVAGVIAFVNWLRKTEAVQSALTATADTFRMAWERIKEVFAVVGNLLAKGLSALAVWIGKLVGVDIPSLGDSISEVTSSALKYVANFALNAAEWVLAVIENWRLIWKSAPQVLLLSLSAMYDIWYNFTYVFLPQAAGFALRKVFDFFVWFADATIRLMIKLAEQVAKALLRIPEMIHAILRGEDIAQIFLGGMLDAFRSFAEGLGGEIPEFSKLFELSERTKNLLASDYGDVFRKIAESKQRLEAARGELLPKPAAARAAAAAAPPGAAAEQPQRAMLELLKPGFVDVRELGRKLQESLLGEGMEDKQARMVELLEAGKRQQEEMISGIEDVAAAVREQGQRAAVLA